MASNNENLDQGECGRRRLLQFAGAGFAGGLAGCGQLSEFGSSNGGSGATGITYYERNTIGETIAEAFNDSHSDINVDVEIGSQSGEGYRPFISQMQADRGPDVLGVDMIVRNKFVESDYLQEISDLISEIDYRDDYFDSIDPLFIEYEGTPYTLPFYISASNYFYNKDHFEEAGLDPENPPETWDEFREAAEVLSDDGPAISLNGIGGSSFLWLPWVWAGGGRFITDDDECVIDEEPGVNALEFWVDLWENDLCVDPVATDWQDMRNLFASEETSIIFDGGNTIRTIKDTGNTDIFDHIDNHPFPRPEGGAHAGMSGGNAIGITPMPDEGSDELDAAREFIQWINSDEGMETILDQGLLPPRQSGFDLEAAQQEDTQHLIQGFADVLEAENTRMLVHPDGDEAKQEYLNPHLEAAYGGDETPEEALSNAAEKINNNILS